MTLTEVESDSRFDAFKIMSMLELGMYLAKCEIYLAKHPGDAEVTEMHEAAKLIRNRRIGK